MQEIASGMRNVAFSAFFMEISFTTVGFENGQNLKLIFEKNA